MVLQCIDGVGSNPVEGRNDNEEFIIQSQEIKYIIQTCRSKSQPYTISVPLDIKVTKDTMLILNIIYV
jgi:hypothetical protein